MKKFTFKKLRQPETLANAFNNYSEANIKFEGKTCGWYKDSCRDRYFHIWISVEDSTEKKGWKVIILEEKFDTEQECRKWIQENTNTICEKFNLHFFEN